MRRPAQLLAMFAATCVGLVGAVVPASADDSHDLIDATPTTVAIQAPTPGRSQVWDMTVKNRTAGSLPLTLTVSGSSTALFDGPTPLQLTVKDRAGRVVIDAQPIDSVLGGPIHLDRLAGRGSAVFDASVSLPGSADNRYQGASGSLTFRFTSSAGVPSTPSETDGPHPPGLPDTGAPVLLLAALVLGLLLTGSGLAVARTTSSNREDHDV